MDNNSRSDRLGQSGKRILKESEGFPMDKKEYCVPEPELVSFRLQDVILGSPEDFNSHLDSSNGDWGGLEPDPDDEIDW